MPTIKMPAARPVILCVNADLSHASVQQKILVRAGYAVSYAHSDDEAVRLLSSRRIDLILLGDVPPQEERAIIQASRDHRVPVVALKRPQAHADDGRVLITNPGNLVPSVRHALIGARAAA